MAELWFWMVSVMVAVYVVLDGFDFGAGTLHLWLARSDGERRQVLAAIGPWWDGNEVWLLAAGGSLLVAFPGVLAAGFSGFYLAMFIVLWLLILRAVGLELRSHVHDPMWRAFWDTGFAVASMLLPVLLGAALGNVLRGVPLDESGYFSLPLFASFTVTGALGLLDWFTVTCGVFALLAVTLHGATFLAWRTTGDLAERSRRLTRVLVPVAALAWLAMTAATWVVQPALFTTFAERPAAWLLAGLSLAGLVLTWRAGTYRRDGMAFLGTTAWLLGLLAATAASVFPVMLRSTVDASHSLTAHGAMAPEAGLAIALRWWFVGLPLALVYAAVLTRIHRERVGLPTGEGHGY